MMLDAYTLWDTVTPPAAMVIHCDSSKDCQTLHALLDAYPNFALLVRSISMSPYLASFSAMSSDSVLALAARCPHLRYLHIVANQQASLSGADTDGFLHPWTFKELSRVDIGSSTDETMNAPKDAFLAAFFALTPNLDDLTIRVPWKMSIGRPLKFPVSLSTLYFRGADQPSPSVVRIITSSASTLRRFRIDLSPLSDGTSQDMALRALRDVGPSLRHLELACAATQTRTAHCLTLKLGTLCGALSCLRHLSLVLRSGRETLLLEQFLDFFPSPLKSLRLDFRAARTIWTPHYWQPLMDAITRSHVLRSVRIIELLTTDTHEARIASLYKECLRRRIILLHDSDSMDS